MNQRLHRLMLFMLIFLIPTQFAHGAATVSHIIQPGETLADIASRYSVDMDAIAAANDIQNYNRIRSWQLIVIPNASAPAPSQPASVAQPAPARTFAPGTEIHVVQRGETLFRVARRYGLTVDQLISINGIEDPTRIHAGNQLRVSMPAVSQPQPAAAPSEAPVPAPEASAPESAPAPVAQAAPASQPAAPQASRQQYVVKPGDFLTQLGIDLDTSWIALAKLNNIEHPYVLHVGTVLLVPERADVELYDPEYAAWKYFDVIAHQPGPRIGVGREIVIVLGTQSTYAYENGVLQKGVRVSTGKKATPTIAGDHEIWLKRRSQTMSGPGYSLDNVEWVMYFYRDYAIHGTWWHTNFGQPMSHGCVNLTNEDAQWFYNFASLGTPVYVRQ